MRRLVAALLLAAAAGCGGAAEPDLADQLREGDLVLLVRHTQTARSGIDDLATLGDCATQRPLTERGRTQARELGAALRRLEVPVGRVVASPFCRTVETAELAFGRTEQDDALLALASVGAEGSPEQQHVLVQARTLVGRAPDPGTVTVLVGHVSTIEPLTGVAPDEGGAVVLRPDGEVVAEVAPGGFGELVDADR